MERELTHKFSNKIASRFRRYCERFDIEPTNEALVEYLAGSDIIPGRIIRNFMVVALYPETLAEAGNKTNAVFEISEQTGLSIRLIWYILKEQRRYEPPRRSK